MSGVHIAMLHSGDPPGSCGVSDYACELGRALTDAGAKVTALHFPGLTPGALRRALKSARADVLLVQYPARAFGASLMPLYLAAMAPCRVLFTLHEYSHAHPLRKLALQALRRTQRVHFIYTSAAEKSAFLGEAGTVGGAEEDVIPVPSNISPCASDQPRDLDLVVHFGLLRPERGIEEFLELAALARRQSRPYRFLLLGAIPPSAPAYARRQLARAGSLGVEVGIGLSAVELSRALARSGFGYLPFPQGASSRRGSLLALLAHGVCTITSVPETPEPALQRGVAAVRSVEDALSTLDCLRGDSRRQAELTEAGLSFALQRGWPFVARRYLSILVGSAG